jgi:beta-glucanase (GH16 family)
VSGLGILLRAASLFVGLAAGAAVALSPGVNTRPPRAPAGVGACKLRPVLIEDFNDLSIAANRIGPARWTAHTPWHGDFGDAVFADPGADGPFAVRDGMLAITARKDRAGRWTSGLIAAADATGAGSGARYGYFEARMKMPPGPGTWPAFWLAALKPAGHNDGNVELDVIEYYGQFTSAYRTALHVWRSDPAKTRGEGAKIDVPQGALVSGFHTYGIDISPDRIVYLLDGDEVWSQPTPPELTGPLYPLVDLALGSGWPIDKTPDPSTLLVDYVHVYERGPGPPVGCEPGLPRRRR